MTVKDSHTKILTFIILTSILRKIIMNEKLFDIFPFLLGFSIFSIHGFLLVRGGNISALCKS